MAMIGFDPNLVRMTMKRIRAVYKDIDGWMTGGVNDGFFQILATGWACEEAIKYTNSFASTLEGLVKDTRITVQNVLLQVYFAGQEWARATGTEYNGEYITLETRTQLDASCIRENINGVRGANREKVSEAIDSLNQIYVRVNAGLSEIVRTVQNSGFIGGSQEESLQASLGLLRNSISESFYQITSSAEKATMLSMQRYGELAQNIANGFSGFTSPGFPGVNRGTGIKSPSEGSGSGNAYASGSGNPGSQGNGSNGSGNAYASGSGNPGSQGNGSNGSAPKSIVNDGGFGGFFGGF
jgi:hypothetical protein